MPDIGKLLKDEIKRVTTASIRREIGPLAKQNRELKREVAGLSRANAVLERQVSRLVAEAEQRRAESLQITEEDLRGARLSARSIASTRSKLKLSRRDFARLAGVSENTIYQWETDASKPKADSKAVLVGLRKLGIREAQKRLEEME